MTFLEAAIEILRRADAAMHFSEVARRAVEENLLSHVGRDPEAAMRTCLNSAVRGDEPIIIRHKPGYYGIRPGAELPDPPPRPAPPRVAEKSSDSSKESSRSSRSGSSSRPAGPSKDTRVNSKGRGRSAEDEGGEADGRKRRRRSRAKGEAPAPASVEVLPVRKATDKKSAAATRAEPSPDEASEARDEAVDESVKNVEFEAPTGSGLEGVTDVALVMANAMSRLVEERPELKDELDALQQKQKGDTEEPRPSMARRGSRTTTSVREREMREREAREREDERGGRRRRRRRRRGKRVDWSAGTEARAGDSTVNDKLLDGVAAVLGEAGTRSLHVRQVAETLANRGVLGGEISEIERAVTAAIMVDIHQRGRGSRFVARGDARYQLQGGRLPDAAAKAEQALREAARRLEAETRVQLVQWLQSLGARALESLVRIYLTREGYQLLASLPPNRGIGKLVVEDIGSDEDEGRQLVLVVPKRTVVEPKLWEGEAERNGCSALVLFSMGDVSDELQLDDARVIGVEDLGRWLQQHRVGVQPLQVEALALDPTFIESIAGLDT